MSTLKRFLLLGALALSALSIVPALASAAQPFEWQRFADAYQDRPANDERDNALVITDVPFDQHLNTALATTADDDPSLPCLRGEVGARSVWYQITPEVDSRLRVHTRSSSYDTALAIWHLDGDTLVSKACNDNLQDEPLASGVTIQAAAGETYWIEVVARQQDSPAQLEIHVQMAPSIR